jgi:hypothetical protein
MIYFNEEEQPHRIDGPAIECEDGHKEYWVNGKLHRIDGPAIEWPYGDKEYWVNGERYTEQEFNQISLNKQIEELFIL